ncbi:hypothetical protein [Pullulanibacillus camelliae]|uniref:hypothetical protein n=1 Tax=Pullulanibacillus camelliae TaxID=1707096 RepID=UPI001664B8AC|nr:hypothetical protein [Pullulanibacillus camelliae]
MKYKDRPDFTHLLATLMILVRIGLFLKALDWLGLILQSIGHQIDERSEINVKFSK